MAAKKSSRKNRKKSLKEQPRRDKLVPAEARVISASDGAVVSSSPEVLAMDNKPLPAEQQVSPVAPDISDTPSTLDTPSELQTESDKPAADNTVEAPSRKQKIDAAPVVSPVEVAVKRPTPAYKKHIWTFAICLIVVAGFLGSLLARSDSNSQVNEEPSASVQRVEQLLTESQAGEDLGKCGSPVPQKATNPQASGSSLQNVPVGGLQSPQLVENQTGQTGDIQTVQPAGCF